ncbi:MAG: AzlD domain-containing protein [Pseudomonadota bacterium]
MISDTEIWILIPALGLATYLIRFSFLGLLAGRRLPPALREALAYVPVTVLPAIVAPMVLIQDGTITPDPARIAGALVGVALGAGLRNVFAAIAGALATYGALTALGA